MLIVKKYFVPNILNNERLMTFLKIGADTDNTSTAEEEGKKDMKGNGYRI